MRQTFRIPVAAIAAAIVLTGCAMTPERAAETARVAGIEMEAFRAGDDLLSAGLGLAGLRDPQPPAFADPNAPTAQELRRRAIWTNWRGIADLEPGGGYGEIYGGVPSVTGREYRALMKVPGATHPHRVMVQVPDDFDTRARCVVVTASSGSRGIYGAISLAGAWGLPRGCVVAYTDKGAGTDWFDTASDHGQRLDGSSGTRSDALAFAPAPYEGSTPRVGVKHAHSGDNPEADWGRHVKQAADFAIEVLNLSQADGLPYTYANTRVIAVGLSNGAGAVLRAAEIDDDWLDGVVAISPNIYAPEGGRALYDYATEAALLMPCALLAPEFDDEPLARTGGSKPPAWALACAALQQADPSGGRTPEAQAADAWAILQQGGWTKKSLVAGTLSVGFDLWRAVAVTYAAAYVRTGMGPMPCGYDLAVLGGDGRPRAPTPGERVAWWSGSSGVPPGAGVGIFDAKAADGGGLLPGLRCLRGLWEGQGAQAAALRAGVNATRASLPRRGLPILLMHGVDDGLVPEGFTSAPYARWANANGREVRYWRIHDAQHFDAFLALSALAARYVPLMPYGYRAMDAMWAHIAEGAELPASADVRPSPRAVAAVGLEPLQLRHLAMP